MGSSDFGGGIINIFPCNPIYHLLTLLIPLQKPSCQIVGPKGAIPTLISTAPFYARLVDIALNETPSRSHQAAESMGANTRQIITKVLILSHFQHLYQNYGYCHCVNQFLLR